MSDGLFKYLNEGSPKGETHQGDGDGIKPLKKRKDKDSQSHRKRKRSHSEGDKSTKRRKSQESPISSPENKLIIKVNKKDGTASARLVEHPIQTLSQETQKVKNDGSSGKEGEECELVHKHKKHKKKHKHRKSDEYRESSKSGKIEGDKPSEGESRSKINLEFDVSEKSAPNAATEDKRNSDLETEVKASVEEDKIVKKHRKKHKSKEKTCEKPTKELCKSGKEENHVTEIINKELPETESNVAKDITKDEIENLKENDKEAQSLKDNNVKVLNDIREEKSEIIIVKEDSKPKSGKPKKIPKKHGKPKEIKENDPEVRETLESVETKELSTEVIKDKESEKEKVNCCDSCVNVEAKEKILNQTAPDQIEEEKLIKTKDKKKSPKDRKRSRTKIKIDPVENVETVAETGQVQMESDKIKTSVTSECKTPEKCLRLDVNTAEVNPRLRHLRVAIDRSPVKIGEEFICVDQGKYEPGKYEPETQRLASSADEVQFGKSPRQRVVRSPARAAAKSLLQSDDKLPAVGVSNSPSQCEAKSAAETGRSAAKSPVTAKLSAPSAAKSPGGKGGKSPGQGAAKSSGKGGAKSPGHTAAKSPAETVAKSPIGGSVKSPGQGTKKSPGRPKKKGKCRKKLHLTINNDLCAQELSTGIALEVGNESTVEKESVLGVNDETKVEKTLNEESKEVNETISALSNSFVSESQSTCLEDDSQKLIIDTDESQVNSQETKDNNVLPAISIDDNDLMCNDDDNDNNCLGYTPLSEDISMYSIPTTERRESLSSNVSSSSLDCLIFARNEKDSNQTSPAMDLSPGFNHLEDTSKSKGTVSVESGQDQHVQINTNSSFCEKTSFQTEKFSQLNGHNIEHLSEEKLQYHKSQSLVSHVTRSQPAVTHNHVYSNCAHIPTKDSIQMEQGRPNSDSYPKHKPSIQVNTAVENRVSTSVSPRAMNELNTKQCKLRKEPRIIPLSPVKGELCRDPRIGRASSFRPSSPQLLQWDSEPFLNVHPPGFDLRNSSTFIGNPPGHNSHSPVLTGYQSPAFLSHHYEHMQGIDSGPTSPAVTLPPALSNLFGTPRVASENLLPSHASSILDQVLPRPLFNEDQSRINNYQTHESNTQVVPNPRAHLPPDLFNLIQQTQPEITNTRDPRKARKKDDVKDNTLPQVFTNLLDSCRGRSSPTFNNMSASNLTRRSQSPIVQNTCINNNTFNNKFINNPKSQTSSVSEASDLDLPAMEYDSVSDVNVRENAEQYSEVSQDEMSEVESAKDVCQEDIEMPVLQREIPASEMLGGKTEHEGFNDTEYKLYDGQSVKTSEYETRKARLQRQESSISEKSDASYDSVHRSHTSLKPVEELVKKQRNLEAKLRNLAKRKNKPNVRISDIERLVAYQKVAPYVMK